MRIRPFISIKTFTTNGFKVLLFSLFLAYTPAIAFSAQSEWLNKCPAIIDLQPSEYQPKISKFFFTSTTQEFRRIDSATKLEIKEPATLVGCYVDFAGINSSSPNGYHIGAINRDSNGFYWINASGIGWRLSPDPSWEFLITGSDNPYIQFGNKFQLKEPSGLSTLIRGAFGMDANPSSMVYRNAWIGTQSFPLPPAENSFGFSYYTTIWPMFKEDVSGISASAGVTWIYSRMQELEFKKRLELCPVALDGLQSMEGGLAWADDQFKFPTTLPKYKLNPVADCYATNAPSTQFWDFLGYQLPERKISSLLISNSMLVPPDGFTFAEESAGGMLGVASMAQPFQPLISASDSETGEQSWMVFFNSENFKGPIALYPPQLWSALGRSDPLKKKFTFDRSGGYLTGAALEWGGMPFTEFREKDGTLYSKIPSLQFPSNSNGETIVMSDFKAYSKDGWYNQFKDFLDGKREAPSVIPESNAYKIKVSAQSFPLYQSGDEISPFAEGKLTALDDGNAFGFRWNQKGAVIELPTVFKKDGNRRNSIDSSKAPKVLQDYSFSNKKIKSHRYETPSWWKGDSSNLVFQANLNDGSTVIYTWVKFIDQPGIASLNLNENEKSRLQQIVINLQRKWRANQNFVTPPTKGSLATFDQGLSVTPPSDKEFGYVPIVLSQFGTNLALGNRDLLNSPNSAFQKLLEQDARAGAAAELKAKQDAELKAKQDAATKPAVIKKTIITCIKGKLIKKIIGLKPKCPKSYKVKK